MRYDRRVVSLISTGPDGIVIEAQLSAPEGTPPDALRARLDVAVRQVVDVFASGAPIHVELGDVWISGRALR